jgi:hypothetical protein
MDMFFLDLVKIFLKEFYIQVLLIINIDLPKQMFVDKIQMNKHALPLQVIFTFFTLQIYISRLSFIVSHCIVTMIRIKKHGN